MSPASLRMSFPPSMEQEHRQAGGGGRVVVVGKEVFSFRVGGTEETGEGQHAEVSCHSRQVSHATGEGMECLPCLASSPLLPMNLSPLKFGKKNNTT